MDDKTSKSLEHAASNLWNCTAVSIRAEKDKCRGLILCKCKLFSSILLSVFEVLCPSNDKKLVSFKCFLVIFKLTIDRDWPKLSHRVQEWLDKSLRDLEQAVHLPEEAEGKEIEKLKLEYLLLNFQSAVKEGDFETARIYSFKADIAGKYELLDASTLLELCRIIYNAALSLKDANEGTSRQNTIALLKDIQMYLELPVADLKAHSEFSNLRYLSQLLLTNCLIDGETVPWDSSECQKYINVLQDRYPKKAEPFILGVKLIRKIGESDNEEAIDEIIMNMIISVDIVSNFDAIVGSICEFAALNTKKAMKCLDYIFSNKFDFEKDQKLLDKVIVTRFFNTTQTKTMTNSEIVQSLKDFSDLVERRLIHEPSNHVISTVVTLLWNSGKKLEKGGNLRQSIGFYELAMNGLLSQRYEDKAKVQRALQNVYINIDEFSEAEKIHEVMDLRDRESPLSQLLLLKIKLYNRDETKALCCLEKIKSSKDENALDVLILAAAECKRCTNLAVRCMLMLLEMLREKEITGNSRSNASVSTAGLLRYTVQMIIKMAEDNPQEIFTKYLDTLKTLFESGVSIFEKFGVMKMLRKGSGKALTITETISVDEVEWFASTSYNIALQCRRKIREFHPEFTAFSLRFIQMIPTQEYTGDKFLHYLYWKFRASLLSIDIKRKVLESGDVAGLRQLQQECAGVTDEIIQGMSNSKLPAECSTDQLAQLNDCLVDALLISFELALTARDQIRIKEILQKAATSPCLQIERLLVESMTSCDDLPSGMFSEVLQAIIERNIANTATSNHLLCSWLASLLDADLSAKDNLQRDLTNRVLARVQTTFDPTDSNIRALKSEVETLATLNWNEGVRCIIRGHKRVAANWCTNSIKFASFGNEALENNLKAMWISLASTANIEDHDHF